MKEIRKIIIDGFDTAIDGHFTLSEYSLSLPTVQEQRQSIAGRDGDIDYTEALSGRPHYNTRKLKATLCSTWGKQRERLAIFEKMAATMHGNRCLLQLPNKPDLYIYGRLTLELKTNHPAYIEIEITGTLDPYFKAKKPQSASITVLAEEENALSTATRAVMQAYTTATNYMFHTTVAVINGSSVGCVLVYRISLNSNATYFFSARVLNGRGSWSVGKRPDGSDGKRGFITTDATGILYLRFVKSSTEELSIAPIVALPVSQMFVIDAGNAAPELKLNAVQDSINTAILIIGDSCNVYSLDDIHFSTILKTGKNYVAAVSYISDTASGTIDLNWEDETL